MDGEKIFCVWYNKGEKYWDKWFNVQERYRGSDIQVEKMMGKVPQGSELLEFSKIFYKIIVREGTISW